MTRLADSIGSRWWRFYREGSSSDAGRLRLGHDGSIIGYSHPNEATWRIDDQDRLSFYAATGEISVVFDMVVERTDGVLLSGRHLLSDIGVNLCLETLPEGWTLPRPAPTRDALSQFVGTYGWDIGDYTYGIPDVVEPQMGHLIIGRFCSIAINVTIVLGNHNYKFATTFPFCSLAHQWPSAPEDQEDHTSHGVTRIGNDVWIGKGAFVASGVQIGDGAVVAGSAVVTRSVPPYSIVGGNPAKVIGYRFEQETIVRLLATRWWDWPDDKIERFIPLMMSEDVVLFLEAAEKEAGGVQ